MSLITDLRIEMNKNNITYYIVPTSDFHGSEYISSYFKAREYLTNFTGSAGTLLVSLDKAYLWVDGRYFIQAVNQIDHKEIILMKSGTNNVPLIKDFIANHINENDTLGFDGRLLNINFVNDLKSKCSFDIKIKDIDLVNNIWNDRPKLPFSLIYKLDDIYTGEEYNSKINKIITKMQEYNADMHILSSLEDQAWLYNLRGNDILRTPVFLSYTIIEKNSVKLFVDKIKLNKDITKYLKENKVSIKDYNDFYNYIREINNKKILVDYNNINYEIYYSIKDKNKIINKENPTLLLKAFKNEIEIKNIKEAQIKDGVALIKFMYQLKGLNNKEEMTELSLSASLDLLRQKQEGFVDLSFDNICAFNENSAIVHYTATEETNKKIEGNGLLLLDSGAHYLEGTTDITRTFGVGKISDEMKVAYTTVLKAHIALSLAIFPKGTKGIQLDVIARNQLWQLHQDYRHGTGHGVGYLLSVHEGPNSFNLKCQQEIEPGMITTCEPGLYLENKFGVRLENEILCIKDQNNDFGEFYKFEPITYVPFDPDCIKVSLLTKQEKEWLIQYHELVYKKISKQLTKPERDWLKDICTSFK